MNVFVSVQCILRSSNTLLATATAIPDLLPTNTLSPNTDTTTTKDTRTAPLYTADECYTPIDVPALLNHDCLA